MFFSCVQKKKARNTHSNIIYLKVEKVKKEMYKNRLWQQSYILYAFTCLDFLGFLIIKWTWITVNLKYVLCV